MRSENSSYFTLCFKRGNDNVTSTIDLINIYGSSEHGLVIDE